VAVARVPDRDPKFISVQMFGRPESFKVEFRILNQAGAPIRYALGEEMHTLPLRNIVTHTSCDPHQLTFDRAGTAQHFEPRNGDRFVVRQRGGVIAVEVERH
jgi:hypothetical protein